MKLKALCHNVSLQIQLHLANCDTAFESCIRILDITFRNVCQSQLEILQMMSTPIVGLCMAAMALKATFLTQKQSFAYRKACSKQLIT